LGRIFDGEPALTSPENALPGAFASDRKSRYVGLVHETMLHDGAQTTANHPACEHDHFAKAGCGVTNKPKYVNMADINLTRTARRPPSSGPDAKAGANSDSNSDPKPDAPSDGKPKIEPIWDLIELLFFAYRDFVGDPDHVLARFGFGRAHHRVLHFVNRNPGMKVAALLDILKITKQSLGRVLKQLIDQGYVEQKEGERDRRQRLLYVTPKGAELALRLADLQTTRIARALGEVGPGAHEAARRFLSAMIDADGREQVLRLIDGERAPTARVRDR
jgi:DNA-binding MarR family transcriptional regulator